MDKGADSYLRFLDGDDEGIVEIVRDYKDGLIFYLNSFVCNLHVAEELTEDTFFRLMVKKPRFKAKYSFKTWLYTVGRNVALDYIRKSSRLSDMPYDDAAHLAAEEESLERSYLREERRISVHRALSRLNAEYGQVLRLIYFEDFSNEEAARVMRKSRRQIEMLIYRAKKALKEEMLRSGSM